MSNWKEFTKGLVKENPNLVMLLGMCPTLAVTTMESAVRSLRKSIPVTRRRPIIISGILMPGDLRFTAICGRGRGSLFGCIIWIWRLCRRMRLIQSI